MRLLADNRSLVEVVAGGRGHLFFILGVWLDEVFGYVLLM
jgi:hypothetical protein